jgi:hypothetical protein
MNTTPPPKQDPYLVPGTLFIGGWVCILLGFLIPPAFFVGAWMGIVAMTWMVGVKIYSSAIKDKNP